MTMSHRELVNRRIQELVAEGRTFVDIAAALRVSMTLVRSNAKKVLPAKSAAHTYIKNGITLPWVSILS